MFDSTPNSSATTAVAGTSIRPVNTGERKNFHYIENIFNPDVHPIDDLHKYVVPQENELIFDVPNGRIHRAAHVDWQATLKTTMVPWVFSSGDAGNNTDQDWIFGVRGGPMMGEALLSVDYSVRPNVARIDATIMRPGAAYALVFLGDDVNKDTGKIISAVYSSGGVMEKNQVPCELAAINGYTNKNIMTTGAFSLTQNEEAMTDGKRCTVVFYDQAGNFIPPVQPLMVQHCAYMKNHQVGIKYVTEVELLSPWFTNVTDKTKLIVPININLLAIELRAIIHYSDGSQSDPLPVNGTRFTLHGLQQYRPKYPTQTGEITLTLLLADNEEHFIAQPGSPKHKSRTYTIVAGNVKGAYSPKIYTYPQWDAVVGGYKLQHFLFDLDRKTFIDVTSKVTFNDQSQPFRPTSYGVAQSLVFNLNLKDVSPTYESVVFIQHTEIVLLKDINGPGTRWSVQYSLAKPVYSALKLQATNAGTASKFKIDQGIYLQSDWLKAMYWAVDPSYDIWDEDTAPTPTHFELMHEDGRRWPFSIADWNKSNAINIEMQKGKTWYINWLNKDSQGNTLQLATTGVTVEVA